MILGIETSCDETSVALLEGDYDRATALLDEDRIGPDQGLAGAGGLVDGGLEEVGFGSSTANACHTSRYTPKLCSSSIKTRSAC